MIRAIFFDVDGTLLSHKTGQVPASARQSLERLREKKIQKTCHWRSFCI